MKHVSSDKQRAAQRWALDLDWTGSGL